MSARLGRKFALVLLLAWIGGFVDAIGFMTLYRLFTAHMSGNSIEFGVAVGTGVWAKALKDGVPIVAFVIGVAVGTTCNEASGRRQLRSTMAVALALEALLLASYLAWSDTHLRRGGAFDGSPTSGGYLLAAVLLVLAMGIQNATIRHAGGERVRTTYVTGVLTDLAESLVGWAFAAADTRRSGPGSEPVGDPGERRREALVLGGVWSIYTAGGILGAITHLHAPRLSHRSLPLEGDHHPARLRVEATGARTRPRRSLSAPAGAWLRLAGALLHDGSTELIEAVFVASAWIVRRRSRIEKECHARRRPVHARTAP